MKTASLPPSPRSILDAALAAVIQPLSTARYEVDFDFRYIETALAGYARDYGLDLAPDFQRGHVWTAAQQSHFIENVMRGVVTSAGLVVQMNCASWDNDEYAGSLPRGMEIIDGLQRLTAVRGFMAGNVLAFGRPMSAFDGSSFDPRRSKYRLRFAVHTFQTRTDLLRHYLALNAGGTPHAPAEIERVRGLLASAAA